jgi:hypothetical protein
MTLSEELASLSDDELEAAASHAVWSATPKMLSGRQPYAFVQLARTRLDSWAWALVYVLEQWRRARGAA